MPDRNATFAALAETYGENSSWEVLAASPFSSQVKWSGATFTGKGSYIAGAAEFILKDIPSDLQQKLDDLSTQGRVLTLAHTDAPLEHRNDQGAYCLPDGLVPCALILIQDNLRSQAAETLAYFAQQGVEIKVISGDGVLTVSRIAKAPRRGWLGSLH